MNNYPFKQLAGLQKNSQAGLPKKNLNIFADPQNGVQEHPFGRLQSSGESSMNSSAAKTIQMFQQTGRLSGMSGQQQNTLVPPQQQSLVKTNSLFASSSGGQQNGALLANSSNLLMGGRTSTNSSVQRNNFQNLIMQQPDNTTNAFASSGQQLSKLDYVDNFGSYKRTSSNARSAIQSGNTMINSITSDLTNRYNNTRMPPSQSTVFLQNQQVQVLKATNMTTTTIPVANRNQQFYNDLMNMAGSQTENSQRTNTNAAEEQLAANTSIRSQNVMARFMNRGTKPSNQLSRHVYSGIANRQLEAATKKPSFPINTTKNLLDEQTRQFRAAQQANNVQQRSSSLSKSGTSIITTTTIPPNAGGQEMIELDDDSDTVDLTTLNLEEFLQDLPEYHQAPRASSSKNQNQDATKSQLFQSRQKQTDSSRYGQHFALNSSKFTAKNAALTSNSVSNLQRQINAPKLAKYNQPTSFQKQNYPGQPQSSYSKYGQGQATSRLDAIDPLSGGVAIMGSSTKRLVEKKRRELEAKKESEEKAKLQKKMALLKKEAEKRKRKRQQQDEDVLADILGMPKAERKTKKKSTEKDFDFLERDIGAEMAALVGDKQANGDSKPDSATKDRNTTESQAKVDSDMMAQRHEEQLIKEREAREKMIRFHGRNRVDELIQPILSLELVKQFYEDDPHGKQLGSIPTTFENHSEYMDSWMPLFLFETYNQMISQKGATLHDRELAELLGHSERLNREFHFQAIIEKNKVEIDYVHLRLFEATNINGIEDRRGFMTFPMLQKMRENDLVLLTEQPLEGADGKPVKKICNSEFLMQMVKKEKQGIFLACVFHSRTKDANYVDVRVDAGFVEEYFMLNQHQLFSQQKRLHCYYFDSLTTIVREFLTIKKSEFYEVHDIILNPVRALERIESSKNTLDKESREDMKSFISRHQHTFNESQLEALNKVAAMHKKDLLLIQGPPGTGKTHTIHGIISMINSCKKRKILVCAPSNAAIDEIVSRISKDKFSTQTRDRVLRVGAMDYDPDSEVRQHSLDYKLERAIEKFQQDQVSHLDQDPPNSASHGSRPDSPQAISAQVGSPTSKKILDGGSFSTGSMTQEEKKKALESIKQTMLLLQRSEHTNEKLIQLIKPHMKNATQFQHFLNIQSRCQKIDTLESMRKALEPKSAPTNARIHKQFNRPAHQPVKPLTQAKRHSLMMQILNRAQIVCTTLSMSASEMFNNFSRDDFEYLIVDEACQSVELTNLIPFQHEPKKIILVGDQQQLPATVFSENGNDTRYSRSMFERFLDCGVKNYMLQIQYRMHPSIREFPSNQFYEGKLKDDKSITNRELDQTLAKAQKELNLQATMFFDLAYSRESTNETSKQNQDEIRFIKELLFVLAKHVCPTSYNQSDLSSLKGRIGIISPYKSQVRQIKGAIAKIRHKLCLSGNNDIEVNTVDAYQGREKDIIIISTVRTQNLGFLRDYRRMNVAITRAKHFLWVIGNEKCLKQDPNWNALITTGAKKSYKFTENPCHGHEKSSNSDFNNQNAMQFIERTLMSQQVGPVNVNKKPQQTVSYNQIFSPNVSQAKLSIQSARVQSKGNSMESARGEKDATGSSIKTANLSENVPSKVEKGVVSLSDASSSSKQCHDQGRQQRKVFYDRDRDRNFNGEKDYRNDRNGQNQMQASGKRAHRDRSPMNDRANAAPNDNYRSHNQQQQQQQHYQRGHQNNNRGRGNNRGEHHSHHKNNSNQYNQRGRYNQGDRQHNQDHRNNHEDKYSPIASKRQKH